MTKAEAQEAFSMMAKNWTFLKPLETEPQTFEVWYSALAEYPIEEVLQGIRNAVKELKKTPVAAEIVEYVENVRNGNRRQAHDVNIRDTFRDAVKCKFCNDHGYINIIFPSGDEAIRPCGCDVGHEVYGDDVFKLIDNPMPRWKQDMYFLGQPMSAYKLIRVMPRVVHVGEVFKYQGTDRQRAIKMYVPWQNTGRKHEEVYAQYILKDGGKKS